MTLESFTIRAYGLCLDERKNILVADEQENGIRFTKFPGGGLELGEGIHDCLIREWKEELGCEIEVLSHFYTTDFFQQSYFNPKQQVISVYYLVGMKTQPAVMISKNPFDFPNDETDHQSFRYIDLYDLNPEDVTFPIDQLVVKMLKDHFIANSK